MNSELPKIEWPDRRVVLLGASNLVFGLPTVLETAQRKWGAPLDFMAALGHGRSYGCTHRVLGRSLRGIVDCGIWSALGSRPTADTAALLTDVGNDIVFGATVDEIAGWVQQCVERLLEFANPVVVTELPLASIESLSRLRFFFARQILFPTSRLKFEEAIDKSNELNQRIQTLSKTSGVRVVPHEADWYGVDPIHIRRRYVRDAWNVLLSSWNKDDVYRTKRFSLYFKARLRLARQEERWLFGIHHRKRQPAVRLSNGTCVSLY